MDNSIVQVKMISASIIRPSPIYHCFSTNNAHLHST